MFYESFFYSFLASGIGCYLYDNYINFGRVCKKTTIEIQKDYKKAIPLVITNLITSYPYIKGVEYYMKTQERNTNSYEKNLAIWLFLTDWLFYSLHLLFHAKYLYRFHKIHHEYIYTYGITSIYAHPVDFIVTNLIPISLPMVIFKFPDNVICHIIIFSSFYTVVISHGGYKLFSTGHLGHHIKRNINYGLHISDYVVKRIYN